MKKLRQKLISTFLVFGFLFSVGNVLAQSPPTFSTIGTFSRAIPEDFLGLNGANVLVDTEDWDEINSNNALAGSPMKTFRFPGGTVSNYWDWRRGFFLQTMN